MSKPVDSNELIAVYEILKRHEIELSRLENEIAGLVGSMREHGRERAFYHESRAQEAKANAQNFDSRVRLYDEIIGKLRQL
jgi:hypothetical protein